MPDISSILMIVGLLVAMYFIIYRPERKKKKDYENLMKELAVGDKIKTIGGLVGKIVDIDEKTVTFETGEDRVRIEITREAIASREQ